MSTSLQPQPPRFLGRLTRRSIGTRLLLAVLGGAAVGLGAMSGLMYQALGNQAKTEIRKTLSIEAGKIETQIIEVEEYVAGLSTSAQSANQFQVKLSLQDYKALTFDFFKRRPQLVMGVGIGQTSYGLIRDRQWVYPYFYADQGAANSPGELLPAPNHNIRYLDVIMAEFYPDMPYYKQTIQARKKIWLDPYEWRGIIFLKKSNND